MWNDNLEGTYDVPLPEALARSLAALPQERQAAFREQVVKLADLFVSNNPVLDFWNVHLDDLDREEKKDAGSDNPLLTLVLAQARMEWRSQQAAKSYQVA